MTWRDVLASDEWRAGMLATSRTSDSRVELIDADGMSVQDVPCDGVRVSMDGESSEMWGCEIQVTNQLIPLLPEDPLDPRANLRIRVWWRELLPSGWVEVPMCTTYPADPAIDDDGIPVVALTGRDSVVEAKRGGYRGQTIKVGGLTVTQALDRLFQVVAPGIPSEIADSAEVLPAKYTLGSRAPDEDWAEIAGLAGFSVWTDRTGVIQVGPAPTPSTPVAQWASGKGCVVQRARREMRTSDMRNRVVVRSTHPNLKKPVVGIAEDTDEGSPTWIGLGRIWEEVIESDAPTTVTAATQLARVELTKRLLPMDTITVTIPARPDLDAGSLCQIARARAGISGDYRVSSWSMVMPKPGESPDLLTVTMKARQRL